MARRAIGLAISRPAPSDAVDAIVRLDEAKLPAVWSTVGGTNPDGITVLSVAASRTRGSTLGTSIVPAYTRHPVVLASQALVMEDFAPGRFRLGVGPSHRPVIEGMFGVAMTDPLLYTREYLIILRQLLWQGRVDFEGQFFQVHAALPEGTSAPRTPLLLSALGVKAFRQAGEISDGAISWVCPVPYLVQTAIPALRAGAADAGRPVPPLIAHVPVALTDEEATARSVAGEFLDRYARLPFYARMFSAAGYPVGADGRLPETLIDELVVRGTGSRLRHRLDEILATGLDELLVTLLPVGDPDALEGEFARTVLEAVSP